MTGERGLARVEKYSEDYVPDFLLQTQVSINEPTMKEAFQAIIGEDLIKQICKMTSKVPNDTTKKVLLST